jgi:PHD/YefM family antitoxin component YafN of YafNO toxin-antitoxin module
MMRVTATELKTQLQQCLMQSRKEPVLVEDQRQTIAVVISSEMYERWLEMEDAFWLMKAQQAADSGLVGTDQALKLLRQISQEKSISWEEIQSEN